MNNILKAENKLPIKVIKEPRQTIFKAFGKNDAGVILGKLVDNQISFRCSFNNTIKWEITIVVNMHYSLIPL